MTKQLTRLYLRVRHSDRGQGTLEYVGILAIVALVIGLAIAGFNAAGIDGRVTELIQSVIGGG